MNDDAQIFQKTTLSNGLRVVSCDMPHTRSIAISIFVKVGSRHESDDEAGVSHFIEHMVFKRTERRPNPLDISSAIESTGGVMNAGAEQELTVYWCKIAQPHFAESLDLLFDMLRNSLYEPEDVEMERRVIQEELAMIDDYPTARVDSLIDEMLWPDHPLGRDVGGTKESVERISRKMLLDHVAEYYVPSNIVVSVAGNVPHAEAASLCERLSRDWPNSESQEPLPVTHAQDEPQIELEYKSAEQVYMSIALPGLSMNHPDRYALDLLSVILGEGMSSRLFVELREKRGLAYDVHSGVAHFEDTGAFVISAGVDPSNVYDAATTILEQVADVRDSLPEAEMERAKRLVSGRLMLRMEDTRSVSAWMGGQELLLGTMVGVDDVVDKMNAIALPDIRRVASERLVTERLNMAVVGPCRGRKRLSALLKL